MAEADDSYVIIKLKHEFDLVKEDADGNYIPVDPVYLPDNAYIYRGMIGEIHFPTTVTIGSDCFKMCASLTTAYVPQVVTIKDGAFNGCELLETLDTPMLRTIGNNSFQGCTSLKTIGTDNVQTIGYNAFQDCESIQSLNFPKLESMGDNCFRSCRNMVSFNAPKLREIGRAVFHGCQSLEGIFLPKVEKVGMATSNQNIAAGVFQECFSLKSIVLPLITEVNSTCFSGCSAAEYISLPKVTTAGLPQNVFADCVSLKWLNIQSTAPVGNMPQYRSDVGIPTSCGVTCLNGEISFPNGKANASSFKRDDVLKYSDQTDAVETTHDGQRRNYIKGVKPGASLEKTFVECYAEGMMAGAFQGRAELETAILPNMKYRIGENAFKGCTNLKQVILPRKTVDGEDADFKIESNAFENCPKLKYLEFTNATTDQVNSKKGTHIWGLKNNAGCVIMCKDGTVTV